MIIHLICFKFSLWSDISGFIVKLGGNLYIPVECYHGNQPWSQQNNVSCHKDIPRC